MGTMVEHESGASLGDSSREGCEVRHECEAEGSRRERSLLLTMALAFQVRSVERRLLPSAPWFGVLGISAGSLWLGSIGFHALASERDLGGAVAAARGT